MHLSFSFLVFCTIALLLSAAYLGYAFGSFRAFREAPEELRVKDWVVALQVLGLGVFSRLFVLGAVLKIQKQGGARSCFRWFLWLEGFFGIWYAASLAYRFFQPIPDALRSHHPATLIVLAAYLAMRVACALEVKRLSGAATPERSIAKQMLSLYGFAARGALGLGLLLAFTVGVGNGHVVALSAGGVACFIGVLAFAYTYAKRQTNYLLTVLDRANIFKRKVG